MINNSKKKVLVSIGSRANYSSIKSFLSAAKESKSIELELVCFASSVVDNFGNVASIIEDDGFEVKYKLDTLLLSDSPSTMAKTTGLSLIELSSVMNNSNPDIVLTVGDRYETMASAIAASYSNVLLAHTMGGELSGSIDESIRHSITKLAHYHFVACDSAKRRVIQMGEDVNTVFNVGCPRLDLAKKVANKKLAKSEIDFIDRNGVGAPINTDNPYVIISIHPVTTNQENQDIESILKVCKTKDLQAVVLWPNADSGGLFIAKQIRRLREKNADLDGVRFFKNLPVELYLKLMSQTNCLIGNSSSGIREGAFLGTPVINIGTRQSDRDRGRNVKDLQYFDCMKFELLLDEQLKAGKYEPDYIYGTGDSGQQIVKIIASSSPSIQKKFYDQHI